MRRIVDALKDLGEKVTGKPIEVTDENLMLYGEDITEILDEITKNYEGGGGGGGTTGHNILRLNTLPPDSDTSVTIEDEEDIANLETIYESIANDEWDYPDACMLNVDNQQIVFRLAGINYIPSGEYEGLTMEFLVANGGNLITISRNYEDDGQGHRTYHWEIL